MRFLLMVQSPANSQPADDAGLEERMALLLEEMAKAGVLLDTAGLRPIDEAVRVRLSQGRQTVVNGPFTESKELRRRVLPAASAIAGRGGGVGGPVPGAAPGGLGDEHGSTTAG